MKNGTEPGQTQPKLEPDTKLEVYFTSRSLKLKFEIETWIWRFGVGEVENDKATNKSRKIASKLR